MISYRKASFLTSAAKLQQLPPDFGFEVAFAGRSNAGKSSVLNCLTGNSRLARTSKTPGRTQLINLFSLDDERRLVDLPGYGYAKVSRQIKQDWQATLSAYLEERECLKGLVLLMDIRHPLKEADQMLAQWCCAGVLPCHILLNKSDKLKRNAQLTALRQVKNAYKDFSELVSVQTFSATKGEGLKDLVDRLNSWYAESNPEQTPNNEQE
ncbi:MAG: ribosome biogenesis GTP-binding protein YihA/YsxC [Pseudomonadota bacterium]